MKVVVPEFPVLPQLCFLILGLSQLYALPQLRALKINLDDKKNTLFLWFYFDGEIFPSEEEMIEIAVDVVKELGCPFQVKKTINRLDFPKNIPEEGIYIYLRDESLFKGQKPNISPDSYRFSIAPPTEASETLQLYLALLYGFLGKIRPNLRAVNSSLSFSKKTICLWFYFEGEVTLADKKRVDEIVIPIRSFLPEYNLEMRLNRLDFPQKIPAFGFPSFNKFEEVNVEEVEQSKPKIWHNIVKDRNLIFYDNAPPISSFLSMMCTALLGKIQPHWRAIQFKEDMLKRKIYVWFYFVGVATKEDLSLVEEILKEVRGCGYDIQEILRRLDFPLPIPTARKTLFLRNENSSSKKRLLKPRTSQTISTLSLPVFKQLKKQRMHSTQNLLSSRALRKMGRNWGKEKIKNTHARDSNYIEDFLAQTKQVNQLFEPLKRHLRAFQFDFNQIEKNAYLLFFFEGDITTSDEKQVREVAQSFKNMYDANNDFDFDVYTARYDAPQKIPKIGRVAYRRKTEEDPIKEEKIEPAIRLKVNAFNALNCKITNNLRAVCVDINEFNKINCFRFYFNEVPTLRERFLINKVVCDSSMTGFNNKVEIVTLKGQKQPSYVGQMVYLCSE